MTEKDICDAYCRIRKIDHTIPDNVLDFMYRASLEKLAEVLKEAEEYKDLRSLGQSKNFGIVYGKHSN